MKIIIVITIFFFCGVISAYSQTDSLLFINYEEKILENIKLKNDLQQEKKRISELSDTYKQNSLDFQKRIQDLHNEVSSLKQKVSDLNENKIKEERDYLQTKVDSLNSVISKQNQIIADKDIQIVKEKANAKTTAINAKNDGKAEILTVILKSYKTKPFDDLIKSTTKESVARDMKLVGSNSEIKPVLNDLQIYFDAQELLSEKFDPEKIKNAKTLLSQIKHESKLIGALKVDVEFYQDFSTDLKRTISKLVDLDKRKSAGGDSKIQNLKFSEIVSILADYMYNYYDYPNYPYLSDIVFDILKRKWRNADADITDLLIKL